MKIIAINGSPRPQGNTAKLLNAFLQGAAGAGAATEYVFLQGLRIHGCIDCKVCKNNNGACSLNDDMQALYRTIQETSVIMLGFPIYMWQMSSQMKTFVDRLYAFLRRDFSNLLNGEKKLVLGATQGNADAKAFVPYLENTAAILNLLGFKVVKTLIAAGTNDTADIARQPDLLTQAETLGAELAKM